VSSPSASEIQGQSHSPPLPPRTGAGSYGSAPESQTLSQMERVVPGPFPLQYARHHGQGKIVEM